jgi:hypothetical protein
MNEPVAWITPPENVWTSCVACGQKVTRDSIHTCSPQLKTLTDEEILKIHAENPFKDGYLNNNLIEFAKAILRKAQK